ncbi:MAG: 4-hydroxy-tetrahydrodipicolinate reductase, partial [Actinobacteria bacterium]|nr:4-hydroxy-tetrahydrodipicolinate reductase [Actinomycetota bacterium]
VHSIRMRGLLAHQEIMFGSQGQTLTIRQDTSDRSSFMPGVVLAVSKIDQLDAGVTVGLDALLGA